MWLGLSQPYTLGLTQGQGFSENKKNSLLTKAIHELYPYHFPLRPDLKRVLPSKQAPNASSGAYDGGSASQPSRTIQARSSHQAADGQPVV